MPIKKEVVWKNAVSKKYMPQTAAKKDKKERNERKMKKNRFLTGIVSCALFLNSISIVPVMASEGSGLLVNGKTGIQAKPDDTLSVKTEAESYKWYQSDSEDGEYTLIENATGSEYVVRWNDEGKYFKCVPDGNEENALRSTEPVTHTELARQNRVGAGDVEWAEYTPGENVFEFDGKEFIVLDTRNNDKAKFFVMTKDFYGEHSFAAASGTGKFDIEDENNIAYWLNNDFLTSGNGNKKLPEKIIEYIDKDYVWKTEKGHRDSTYSEDYYTKGGVALMSQTEWVNYAGKFGIKDAGDINEGWWLRSSRGQNISTFDPLMAFATSPSMNGQTFNRSSEQSRGVRPIFNLSRSFFIKNNIEADKLGSNVKKLLCDVYTAEELAAAGYNVAELKTSVKILTNGKSTSAASPDDTISASVESSDGNVQEKITYQWYVQEDDSFAEIEGAVGKELIVRWNDEGKTFKCGIILTGEDGNESDEVFSDNITISHTAYSRQNRVGTPPEGFLQDTPDENVFEIGGKEFILLKVKNNDKAKFFVMTKDFYGNHSFSSNSSAKFDVTQEGNIAYWLNNDFLTSGNGGKELPKAIKDYIDYDYVWKTEPGLASTDYPTEYYTKSGVAVMSQTEWLEYTGKFGVKDAYSGNGWWLRTTRAVNMSEAFPLMAMVDYSTGGVSWMGQTSQNQTNHENGVRPVFHLSKDFFKNNKLDEIGQNVKSVIKELYTRDEMAKIYTAAELLDIGYLPEYEVGDATFVADGEETIIPEGDVTASFVIKNNTNASKNVIIYAAGYEGDKLSKVELKGYTLNKGEDEADIEIKGLSADTLKIFIWDKDTMKPISDKVLEL